MGSILRARRKASEWTESGTGPRASVRRPLQSAVKVHDRLFDLGQLVDIIVYLCNQLIECPPIGLGHRPFLGLAGAHAQEGFCHSDGMVVVHVLDGGGDGGFHVQVAGVGGCLVFN